MGRAGGGEGGEGLEKSAGTWKRCSFQKPNNRLLNEMLQEHDMENPNLQTCKERRKIVFVLCWKKKKMKKKVIWKWKEVQARPSHSPFSKVKLAANL